MTAWKWTSPRRERQPAVMGPVAGADTEGGSQCPAQVCDEPRPQHPGMRLPQHRAFVVVALRVERTTDARVVAVVTLPAAAAADMAARGDSAVCTGPNDGAVKVTNARGCSITVAGTPFAVSPASPARSRWNASAQ
jgi:hypothetical protein